MAGHVYMRVGRYEDAAAVNRQAIRVDATYRATAGSAIHSYAIYMAHNYHFLWAADLWTGHSAEAASAEAGIFQTLSPEVVKDTPELMDYFSTVTPVRLVRFARWDEILALAPPPPARPLTTALWHFARGTALAAKGDRKAAQAELATLEVLVPALSNDKGNGSNALRTIATVGLELLRADLLTRDGKREEALRQFAVAAKAEDALSYDEPADWQLPVRQALGRVLLSAGRPAEAAVAFREDLERNPENGWSLRGLAQALEATGDKDAVTVRQRFAKAWSFADVAAP
jgi:tetratricopeptide (TPR) repeat protein